MPRFLVSMRIRTFPRKFVVGAQLLTDISVGDRFVTAVPSMGYSTRDRTFSYSGTAASVDLVVTEIEAYGRKHETWSRGMTAQVTLEGDDNLIITPCIMLTADEKVPPAGLVE